MGINVDIPPIKECKNIDSWGMICVRCNQCHRFDKEKTRDKKGRFIKKPKKD